MDRAVIVAEIEQGDAALSDQLVRLDTMLPCRPGEEYCDRCDQVTHCKMSIDVFFEDLLGFMQKHFAHEEDAMHQLEVWLLQNKSFEDHKEAHADLMQNLVRLVGDNRSPAKERQLLKQLVRHWLDNHVDVADAQLLASFRQL